MASPQTIELILQTLIGRIRKQYSQFITAILLDQEFDTADLVETTARALLLADLEGRTYAVAEAQGAGIDFAFDEPEALSLIPDLPEALHYAKANGGSPKIPGLPPAVVAIGAPRIGKAIQTMPLKKMAEAFRRSVPGITARILAQARRMGDHARLLWARESTAILEVLAPMLQRQLAEGVSLAQFFLDAESLGERAEFGRIARSRLENIFRTNLSTAAGEAAFEESHDGRIIEAVRFYRYRAVSDNRVRPQHWAFDGFTAPKDWPYWRAISIPNGNMCRCPPAGTLFLGDARRMKLVDDLGVPIAARYKKTWSAAIAAGLLTQTGDLTFPRVVQMIGRNGEKVADSFPQQGFGG